MSRQRERVSGVTGGVTGERCLRVSRVEEGVNGGWVDVDRGGVAAAAGRRGQGGVRPSLPRLDLAKGQLGPARGEWSWPVVPDPAAHQK